MHKGKSMFLTILCMGVILGFGYLLIMGLCWKRQIMRVPVPIFFMGRLKRILKYFPGIIILGMRLDLAGRQNLGYIPCFSIRC